MRSGVIIPSGQTVFETVSDTITDNIPNGLGATFGISSRIPVGAIPINAWLEEVSGNTVNMVTYVIQNQYGYNLAIYNPTGGTLSNYSFKMHIYYILP